MQDKQDASTTCHTAQSQILQVHTYEQGAGQDMTAKPEFHNDDVYLLLLMKRNNEPMVFPCHAVVRVRARRLPRLMIRFTAEDARLAVYLGYLRRGELTERREERREAHFTWPRKPARSKVLRRASKKVMMFILQMPRLSSHAELERPDPRS